MSKILDITHENVHKLLTYVVIEQLKKKLTLMQINMIQTLLLNQLAASSWSTSVSEAWSVNQEPSWMPVYKKTALFK